MAPSQPNPSLLSDPRMEVWHDFIQTDVILVPLLLHSITLTSKDQAERLIAFISQCHVPSLLSEAFYLQFTAAEWRCLQTVSSGMWRPHTTRSDSLSTHRTYTWRIPMNAKWRECVCPRCKFHGNKWPAAPLPLLHTSKKSVLLLYHSSQFGRNSQHFRDLFFPHELALKLVTGVYACTKTTGLAKRTL